MLLDSIQGRSFAAPMRQCCHINTTERVWALTLLYNLQRWTTGSKMYVLAALLLTLLLTLIVLFAQKFYWQKVVMLLQAVLF
jgi:hypothetical protein